MPDGSSMIEKPILFVIHGGPGGEHGSYKPTLSPLANRVQIVYFDLRGQGRSARGPKESYTLENNVEDMEALRKHLGLTKIAALGTSYGGIVAMAYAIKYSKNVSHLILVATSPDSRCLNYARQSVAGRGTEEQKAAVDALLSGRFENDEAVRDYLRIMGSFYSLKYNPMQAEEKLSRLKCSAEASNFVFAGFIRDFDLKEDLHKIECPTLILAGRHDWICPPELSQDIAQLIPHSDLRIFENSSHAIASDETEAYLDAIKGFFIYK